ncbi:MAG: hypothetical protein JSU66_02615 [Deltaproteobacteria bacterium]|nr:MAG: hypothetical protein JSU66_02615 [Deltaproteobacteria bacterium]
MRDALRLLLLCAVFAGGCASYDRGALAAASTAKIAIPMTVVEETVEGRSCEPMEPQFNLASQRALAAAPGANALIDVSYHFERFCMIVRGTAVRVGP